MNWWHVMALGIGLLYIIAGIFCVYCYKAIVRRLWFLDVLLILALWWVPFLQRGFLWAQPRLKKAFVPMFLILPLLSGCATYQTLGPKFAAWDLQNAETSRQLAKDMLSTWLLNSGFIRGALGGRIKELPAQALDAMNELDIYARKANDLDDFALGKSLGLRVRMLTEVVLAALNRYAPEVLKYLL